VDKDEMPPIVEDIQIMSQILDKALGRRSAGRVARHVTKAVDDVLTQAKHNPVFPSGPYDQTRGVFLEGYGALFLTEVDCPFIVAPDKSEEPEDGDVEESVWEKTKRQLETTRKPETRLELAIPEVVGFHARRGADDPWESTIEYTVKKVEQLQKTLLETLKHATNIRSLKPEDTVAIVVQGEYRITMPRGEDPWRIMVFDKSSCHTVLTLRVKKSDIDAFARGDLSFDAWRKKVTIVTH